jgi:hypothetical protein
VSPRKKGDKRAAGVDQVLMGQVSSTRGDVIDDVPMDEDDSGEFREEGSGDGKSGPLITMGVSYEQENEATSDLDLFLECVQNDLIGFYQLSPTLFVSQGWDTKTAVATVSWRILKVHQKLTFSSAKVVPFDKVSKWR